MKVILGMAGCPKCQTMKAKHPDWQYTELEMDLLLKLGGATGISSMPMILSDSDE